MRSVVGLGLVVLLGACSTASQPAPLGGASTLAALRAIPSVRAPSSAHLRRTDKGFVGKDSATKHAVFPVRSRGALRLESDERADVWIEVRPRDGKDVDAELVDGTLVFRAVAPSTDVVFVDERHRVEEWRLLRDAAAPTTTRYEVRVGAGVGTLRTRAGRIEVLDADGRVHLTTDDLVAIDARGERRALAVALEKQAEGYTFSLALDPAGLAFPIAVDPAWTGGPLMVTGRGAHAAVTLLDGRVLVIGGYGGGGALETNATEIYDPATNTFTASTGNGQGECQAVAMLASGLVLRAGGTTKLGPVSSASTFSHLTSAWTVAANPPYRLCGAAAVALDANRFLVCGGSNAMGATGNDCETYNPSTNTWTLVAKQNVVRSNHTLTVLGDGTVLSTGGDSGGSASATAERYNPGTNTWTNVPAMKVARSNHTATRLGSGKVLVVGNGTGTQLFDPGTSTWSDGGPLAVARTGHTATLLPDGRVLVAGGGPTSAELYDPATNTFSTAGAMITPRSRFASALLPSGRVLATGDYSSATTATEIWGQLVGATCAANHECANNHCVDNVCCSSASCAAGAVCNLAGKLGTCTKPLGASCGAGTECVSGQCVDGYCCNSACTAQCSACNVAGKLGTCTPVLGSPVGGRTACSGAGLGTTCGARCDGYDGGKCNFAPTTTACGTDGCATGVETHVGTCNGAGACNSTSKTCGLYKCGATSCLTTCTATSDCITGYRCKDGACAPAGDTGSPCLAPTDCSSKFCADGFCCEAASCGVDGSCGLPTHEGTCRTKQGKACTKNDDCGSDHCVDGVCCDLACDGQCEACDVEGKVGLCAPVTGAPHSGRPKCDDGGGDACKAKTCKGASSRVACEGYVNGPTVTCAPAKCEDSSFTTVSKCDGAGTCASPGASSCVPYKCGPTGCLKTCTKTDECAKGYACLGNRCEGVSAACSDDGLQAIGRDGVVTDCAPYRCLDTGECGKSCETSSSCGPGYACDVATKTCSPAAPPTADSGGCSMNGGARSGSGGLLGALLGVVGIVAARRRRLLSSALGAAAAFSAGCGNRTEPPSTQGPVVTVEDPLVPAKKVPAFAARIARAEAWASKGEGFVGGQRLTAEIPLRANAAVRLGPKDRDDVFVEVVALEASEVRAVVRDSVVTFVDALPDTDVLHVVDAAGVEELRTLRSTRAPTTVRYRVTHGPGIARVRVREGRIEAVSAAGRVEIGTAPLFAVDAAGKRRSLTLSIEGDVVTAALDTTGLAFPVVVDPAWSLVATMSEPRMIHALVTLADGRLMVVGGESKTAEIYDAVANTWSSGGDTGHFYGSYPDWEFGAAPLPSGKVLVRFDTADRWNPATNTWSPAGSPTVQRTAMVPLLSGKVLALCPASAATADAIVESYDDATNAWTNTTSMTTARALCTAIRLLDGRVLVAGGRTSGGPLSSAEIFDPAASKWTATGNMVTAGGRRSALLHSSGKVVLAGPGTLAEVYDPATGKFTSLPAMATVRDRAAMAELKNGRVLVAGGVTTGSGGNFTSTSLAELYDFATNTWSTGGTMGAARAYFPAIRLPTGRVLAIGGASKATGVYGTFREASAELYGGVPGTVCTSGWECASGNCVDGVCCTTAACPFAAVCNTKEKSGTCAKVNGLACGGGTECATGQCADGYCCDTACKGQCEACDLPSKFGVCSPVLGPPRGARSACASTGGDALCGNRCDGSDRVACHTPGAAAACGANACVGGVETHASTCDVSGKCGDVAKSCGAYACDVTTCKSSCSSKADCAPGYQCKTGACFPTDGLGTPCKASSECATGFCTDGVCCGVATCAVGSSCAASAKSPGSCAKLPGTSCTLDAECGSGACVDGVCCTSACTGQCEACDVPGSLGKCTPVAGDPHGTRAACDSGAGDACKARTCDGAKDPTTCVAFTNGTAKACKAASCAGTDFVAESVCDGAGGCTTPPTQACAPYRCDDAGCRTSCAKKEHCADGATCVKGACLPIVATCSTDRLSSTDKGGTVTDCSPYRCGPVGQCLAQCASSADCAPGSLCDVTAKTCSPLDAGSGDGGGCSFGGNGSVGVWSGLLGFLVLAGRRRRACASR